MERSELLEAMLDSLPEGLAVLGSDGRVAYWNPAAEAITGFVSLEVVGYPVGENLESLLEDEPEGSPSGNDERKFRLRMRHKQGYEIPVAGLRLILRDELGGRIGRAVLFRPLQNLDALPHGETGGNAGVALSQQEMEELLTQKYEDFRQSGEPFGVLWIAVDQAAQLRRTHGAGACEAMLTKVRQAMAQGLRASEDMGRWGADEFLVIAHERTAEMLSEHAQRLAGLARTADFRWWGDRVQLTVSIGARQAKEGESTILSELLEQARKAMEESIHAGGNAITPPPGGKTCLPL